MIENLIAFSIASFFLALSPGPDNIYVIAQSLANGTKSGIATATGLVSGIIIHTTLLAFGVSVIITKSPLLFYALKVIGALYLLFLAFTVYTSDASISFQEKAPKKSFFELFKQGFIMNLINPKVLVFFLGFFSGFLWDESQKTILQFYILGAIFMIVAFTTFALLSVLAGGVRDTITKHKNTGRVLKWMQILVFIGIAVYILLP